MKRGALGPDTHRGRAPCDGAGRDWGEAATSPGIPKISSQLPGAKEEAGALTGLAQCRLKSPRFD